MIQPIDKENTKATVYRALMRADRGKDAKGQDSGKRDVTKYTDLLRPTVLPFFVIVLLGGAVASFAQPTPLEDAQRLFYNGRYEAAADATLPMCAASPGNLAACELRTSSLLFQIKRLVGDAPDKDVAWKACATCDAIMAAFTADTARGQALARARLAANPADETGLFFLGKIDLNYVWLHLGTLGRKTGWTEYWEARKSLDQVLKQRPDNVRARVSRAWIDYIVGTKIPRGVRWLLGGGNKKRGLSIVRDAAKAEADADVFVRAETEFALWDMQVREKNFGDALVTARDLAIDFPDNQELRKFIETHQATVRRE